MDIPELTHPQCNALAILAREGELSGRKLHQKLTESGDKKTPPNFYLFMKRLEDSRCVETRFETKVVEGHTLREKHYKIASIGEERLAGVFEWYDKLKTYAMPSQKAAPVNEIDGITTTTSAATRPSNEEVSAPKKFQSRIETSIWDGNGTRSKR